MRSTYYDNCLIRKELGWQDSLEIKIITVNGKKKRLVCTSSAMTTCPHIAMHRITTRRKIYNGTCNECKILLDNHFKQCEESKKNKTQTPQESLKENMLKEYKNFVKEITKGEDTESIMFHLYKNSYFTGQDISSVWKKTMRMLIESKFIE